MIAENTHVHMSTWLEKAVIEQVLKALENGGGLGMGLDVVSIPGFQTGTSETSDFFHFYILQVIKQRQWTGGPGNYQDPPVT